MLLLIIPAAHGQAFQTLQSQDPSIVTPKFVPAPQHGRSVIVPAVTNPVNDPQVVIPTGAQMPAYKEDGEMLIRTELPGKQRLFGVRQSEDDFFERINKDLRKNPGQFLRPEEPIVSKEPYRPRIFPPMTCLVEPSYVCHCRLYFEQPNFERTGWDLGVLQPAVHLGVFYYDTIMLPYHIGTDLRNRTECNVGKCLPGDPAPLLLYRERFSVTGLLAEVGALSGAFILFAP